MIDEGHQDIELKDGERTVEFTGVLLGRSSSAAPGKTRWAEISIYRTVGGKYIVAGVGRTTEDGEVDRHWTQVCERPDGVIERLYLLDQNDSRYLPRVSRNALEQAIMQDGVLRDAFLTERVE